MPPTELHVGMMRQNSPLTIGADDVNTRLHQLRQGMREAFALPLPAPPVPPPPPLNVPPPVFDGVNPPLPPPPPVQARILRIFMAPEYFFRKNWANCQHNNILTAYTAAEKNTIYAALARLSRPNQNFLLIGGSILWHDNYPMNMPIIRHSVPIFYSGQLVCDYEKKNDCAELQPFEVQVDNRNFRFSPGRTSGYFLCDGLRCGIETCVDHGCRQLRRDRHDALDLHFIVSNSVTVQRQNAAAHARGYIIQADAANFGLKVYHDPFDWNNQIGAANRSNNLNLTRALFRLAWPAPILAPLGNPGLRIV